MWLTPFFSHFLLTDRRWRRRRWLTPLPLSSPLVIAGSILVLLLASVHSTSSEQSLSRHSRHQSSRKASFEAPSSKPLSRLRRVPRPEPEVSSLLSTESILEDQAANLYKPEILNCDANPSILEESERSTAVVQVKAIDNDNSSTPAGQIVYSIVSTHNKFSIDPKSGWLSTNKVFNRDEPEREKLVHVTIKASDRGRPSLENVCTIAVKIEDINDNAPIFDRASYEINLPQDTPEGTTIMRVSATDIDEGDNQKITYDLMAKSFEADIEYFRWDDKTGVVWLNKKLDKPVGSVFILKATAKDGGLPSKMSEVDVNIDVKESNNKPPIFRQGPGAEIEISEGMQDYSTPIASYTADSQVPDDPTVFFELVNGRTEQTNKDATFRAVVEKENESRVNIFLAKALEYEKVQSYTLTLQVRNSPDLVAEAQLNIKVKDENNKSPVFTNIDSGAVLEHEPPGTVVMEVSAIDGDGTYPNNRVKYFIADSDPSLKDKFEINPDTGVITTKVEFDREERSVYALTIVAEDGQHSSLLKNGKPNQTPQKFRIVIKDKNDNPPYFPQQEYRAEVPEDADVGSKVIEVKAKDLDTEASLTTYSIVSGNLLNAFRIEEQTGFIRVDKPLDYENIRHYTLLVRAWDGQFSNDTTVHIDILNVNDLRPQFREQKYETTIKENEIPSFPVITVFAIDPDIGDTSVPQNITYFLDQTNQIASYFQITPDGAIRVVKALDRDLPNGFPKWSMFVFAKDENGAPTGLESFVEFTITVEDVNDNAPFLNMPDGLVWPENTPPGEVGKLEAVDYDEPQNGPPFRFQIDPKAPPNIKAKFLVKPGPGGDYYLYTKVEFDREEQKVYEIPVLVEDNQGLGAVSYLKLVIGDKNDNPMKPGASEIFVYNYEGQAPATAIGRVYVDDPDDWDLPDKKFYFKDPSQFPDFQLDSDTGTIIMKEGIRLNEETDVPTTYFMQFRVEDRVHGQVGPRAVEANVTVRVQRIPREAVLQSGSIRLAVAPETFVAEQGRERLTHLLKAYLHPNSSGGGVVDVFTLLPAGDNGQYTDVRFAAHGSPYFAPERMEVTVARRKADLERSLGNNLRILMIHVDECLLERGSARCEGSCYNDLEIDNRPTAVMTNTTTFVGVTARVVPVCGCRALPAAQRCTEAGDQRCLNGGVCEGRRCKCPADNEDVFGPNCEKLSASYRYGWTTHKGFSACGNMTIKFKFTTKQPEGLLLYQGPSPNTVVENVTDYFALELDEGKLKYYLNFGDQTQIGTIAEPVADGEEHLVVMSWSNSSVSLIVDDGACSAEIRNCQIQNGRPAGRSQIFNSNGPLQVGGLYFGPDRLRDLSSELGLGRSDLPRGAGFAGCIRDLKVTEGNHEKFISLGTPADGENYKDGCNMEYVLAVEALGMNLNFLIIILVVLAIILATVVFLAMYRRRRTTFSDKDIDCDIRENIINYEDEGGGEGDQTGYDLSVLRMLENGTGGMLPLEKLPSVLPPPPIPVPGVKDFLDENKDRADMDPEGNPYDDLRHYAYEGDGNSGGSLSSLNSGTDDADLEFEYLHNFGPRFKKLADMYGRESDSEDSQDEDVEGLDNPAFYPQRAVGGGGPPGSESWC